MGKSKLVTRNEKIASVIGGAFKKIEDATVGAYILIEDAFVNRYLVKDGETMKQAKERLKQKQRTEKK